MDMSSSNFRPEIHVAQQSRRDKLRIQQDSNPSRVYPDNLGQIPTHHQDSLPYNYCPEMLNLHQESDDKRPFSDAAASFGNFCRAINPANGDPHCFSTWKSIGSQPDWDTHQPPIFVADGLSGSQFKPPLVSNKTNVVYQDPSTAIPIQHAASSVYQNTLQDLVVTTSDVLELGHRNSYESGDRANWTAGGNAVDQSRLKSHPDWISRAPELWGGEEFNYAAGRNGSGGLRTGAGDTSTTQALSLSLSSDPSPKVQTTQISIKNSDVDGVQGSRNWKPEYLSGNLSTGGKVSGNSRVDLGTLAMARRNPGPLGPFTGYATILRSSKFLRPAQQLLDDLCCFSRPQDAETCEVPDKILGEVRVSDDAVSYGESAVRASGDSGDGSSFVFNDSNDKNQELGGVDCSADSFRPDNLQKKAKLLYMQDEVCKRYKQYHQQMQMVVSSFESVAGLSAATPYVSLALKMVSKHFRCLKNAITDQLKSIRNASGEDLLCPTVGTSVSNGGAGISVLKFFDQSLQKQKRDGGLGSILEGQHIWRPQRGLPERAVSVLRAWLFDHFLHPYPTDTDKHMLASQTGLTRNQVSNWFINARVRLWKPMVEEIHMLETKGLTENGKAATEPSNQANNAPTQQSFNMLGATSVPNKELECLNNHPSECEVNTGMGNANAWNQDKRSRVEYHTPSSMGGSLMELVPGIEMGPGLGAVSLTLGLRQNVENAQRPPLPLQQEHHHHMRLHFGGHIIRDYVG